MRSVAPHHHQSVAAPPLLWNCLLLLLHPHFPRVQGGENSLRDAGVDFESRTLALTPLLHSGDNEVMMTRFWGSRPNTRVLFFLCAQYIISTLFCHFLATLLLLLVPFAQHSSIYSHSASYSLYSRSATSVSLDIKC